MRTALIVAMTLSFPIGAQAQSSPLYTPLRRAAGPAARLDAQVAQLVEHATENRSVGGSIPPLGTIAFFPSAHPQHDAKAEPNTADVVE